MSEIPLPEHDTDLQINVRSARRMLRMLGDSHDTLQSPHPEDRKPPVSFRFVIARDAPPHADNVKLEGTFGQCADRLVRANVESRCGIYVEMPIPAIVATVNLSLYEAEAWAALPGDAQPSIRIAEPKRQTWTWLLSKPATAAQRKEIAEALVVTHDAKIDDSKLMRLSGFYSRVSRPVMLQAIGNRNDGEACGFCDPAELARQLGVYARQLQGVVG